MFNCRATSLFLKCLGLNLWLRLFRYEEEINRRTTAENEFVALKKVSDRGVDTGPFVFHRGSRVLLWTWLTSNILRECLKEAVHL